MKTDQLINLLSTNLEPVKRGETKKTLTWTILAGGLAAVCLMLATVGLRPGGGWFLSGYLLLKLLFMLILIGAGPRCSPNWSAPARMDASSTRSFCWRSGYWIGGRLRTPSRAAGCAGPDDDGVAMGDLRLVHTAVCHRSVFSPDLGITQRSAYQFETHGSGRRTCRRSVGGGGLRLSLSR